MSFKGHPEAGASEPGYVGHFWHSEASPEFLQLLVSTYHILDIVAFEALASYEMAVGLDGLASRVILFPSIFSCGRRLPFPLPVHEVLYNLELAPAQLHPNA